MQQVAPETRVKFVYRGQTNFINNVCKQLTCHNLKDLSKYSLGVSYSTLKKYKREELLLPYSLLRKLCKLANYDINDLLIKEYLPQNWGKIKGGKRGIRTTNRKYKQQLPLWRTKNKNYLRVLTLKHIIKPNLNEELAEFLGICLGDGTATEYFVRISGDSRYDEEYFNYVTKLIRNLFGTSASMFKDKRKNTLYLQLSSKLACKYLTRKFGLPLGNKFRSKIRMPSQIQHNKKLSAAFLRGLVDTDGSVSRRGKQFCIQFYSYNKDLIELAYGIGKSLGVFTYSLENETGTNSAQRVYQYFKTVGSSNPKHIIRFREYLKGKRIYFRDIPNLRNCAEYKNLTLPYKYTGP